MVKDADLSLRMLCLAALLVSTWARDSGGAFELQKTTSDIQTVLGCTETLVCEGPSNSIDWTTSDPRNIISSRTVTVDAPDGGEFLRSHITLANITIEDQETYKCNIRGDKTFIMTASVTVINSIVHIAPLPDIDISDRAVGETLSICCQVTTCQPELSVAIIKGDQLLVQKKYNNAKNILLDADLVISSDTADRYACRVLLPTGSLFTQVFTVTGTPDGIPYHTQHGPAPSDKSANPTSITRNSSAVSLPCITAISALYLFVVALLYQ